MLETLTHAPWYVTESFTAGASGLAMGRVSLGFVNTARQPAQLEDGALLAVMDGELYDIEEVVRDLRRTGCDVDPGNQAEILLHGYRNGGPQFMRRLHGSFAAAIWDAKRHQLVLVNDRFGSRPLYYVKLPGRLLFASSIKSLMADPEVSREPSWTGIAQFFTFGHYLRNDTSLDAVRVIPAAAWMTFDVENDKLTTDPYWQWGDDAGEAMTGAELLDRIDEAFKRAVDRRVQDTPHLGLALSGGLDARTILGVIDHEQTPLRTLCLGMKGSLDHRAAERLAQLVGCRHHNHVLDSDFLSHFRQHLEDMVRLTDGQYLSQCIVMPTLSLYRKLGIQVLLRGHAGELMHMQKAYNYSLDHDALAANDSALEDWLYWHLQAYMLSGVEKPLFAGTFQQEMSTLARQALQEDIEETNDVEAPVQRVWHLFVKQRLRRETVLSLAKFRSVVEPRLPYLDNDLVPILLSAPPNLKLGETIQTYILRQRRPSFLKVVNANTGTSLGAGRLSRRVATLRMRVLAKLGVPGYQPYERLGLWLRRELAPIVREILLSPQCLDRGIFEPPGVKSVVSQHFAGRNHTYLLLAMMIFELGQRYLLGEAGVMGSPEEIPEPESVRA